MTPMDIVNSAHLWAEWGREWGREWHDAASRDGFALAVEAAGFDYTAAVALLGSLAMLYQLIIDTRERRAGLDALEKRVAKLEKST